MRGLIYANGVGNWHGYWLQLKVILQAATRESLEVVIGATQPPLLHCWWYSASIAEQTFGGGCKCSVIWAHARCRCQSEPAASWDRFVSHNILWVQAHISAQVTLLRGFLEQPDFPELQGAIRKCSFSQSHMEVWVPSGNIGSFLTDFCQLSNAQNAVPLIQTNFASRWFSGWQMSGP